MNYKTRKMLESLLYSTALITMVYTFYLRFSGTRTVEYFGKTFRVEMVDAVLWTPLALLLGIRWFKEGKTMWALLFFAIAIWKGYKLFKF